MNTPQQYVDQRNELYLEWREARNTVSHSWRMRKSEPQQYKLLRTREKARMEQLDDAERLAKQICGEFGLRLCRTCTTNMYIYESRREHAGIPLLLVAQH